MGVWEKEGGVVKRVPTSVVVVVIVGLAYTGIDVLGTAANFVMYVLKVDFGRKDPGLEFVYNDALAGVFTGLSTLLTAVFALWMVAGGVGSLRLKPWARRAMVRYGWTNLAAMVVVEALHAGVIVPRMLAQYPPGPARTMAYVEQVVAGLMVLVPVGLSVAILLIYRRASVKAAFAGRGPAIAGGFPVEMAGGEVTR